MSATPEPPQQPSTPSSEAPATPARRRSRWRRWLRISAIGGGIALLFGAISLAGAEYYTGRPDFCGSCHVMDPYYNSWQSDKHGGKLGIWCIECHYAPGERHTFMAKFRGLSQAASYFSGRFGAGRPRAHVNDGSCLQSKCHGDGEYLGKSLVIGEPRMETRKIGDVVTEVQRTPTVRFAHSKHLDVTSRLEETRRGIEDVSARLKNAVPGNVFAAIRNASISVERPDARQERMRNVLAGAGLSPDHSDAFELMRLEHSMLRLRQLDGINCAACHMYDGTGDHHFAVNFQACYTCHFANETFNQATASCLKCHSPPTRQIAVHETASRAGADPATSQQSALMDHQDIIQRGIDCASCHMDVVQGHSTVTIRECTHCHDQDHFLAGFESRTTQTVAEYHKAHVAMQRARCQDCHTLMQHKLIDPQHVGTSAGFVKPVLDDCQHCHPNHHREQVDLLMGRGGRGELTEMPNAMFGSRVNCRACHSQSGSDFKGAPLIEATAQTCVACHSTDYEKLFAQWRSEIDSHLKEATEALERVEAEVRRRKGAGEGVPQRVQEILEAARTNIRFVENGNGIHNKNYALQVLDLSVRQLDEAMTALASNRGA